MWESNPSIFLGGVASTTSFMSSFSGVVVPLEGGKGPMSSNRHNMLVVPSFPDFPRDESMSEVMEVEVLSRQPKTACAMADLFLSTIY